MLATVATAAAVCAGLAACGGSSSGGGGGTGTTAAYNAGVGKVFNPSDAKGGVLTFANSDDWDSLDPADTYYAYSWDFARLYGRALLTFAPKPGADGAKLVPDLATGMGVPSDNAKTWTYHIRPGIKFEDGTPVTTKDVKYAVERSLDKTTFPNGPTYFNDFLDLQGYTSPYKDPTPGHLGLKAIDTPDDTTIVFHLNKSFSGFDYFAQLPATMPVPQSKDTGTNYKKHVISTGPYMFSDYQIGKSFKLIRNPNWDQATDPIRKALPNEIDVQLHVDSDDMDNRLISGDLDVAVEGTGVGSAAQSKILSNPQLKANADSALVARLWYTNINGDVAPLNNIACRQAIEYAADKTGYQRAYGGPTGGDIATNLMPSVVPGAQAFDTYPDGADHTGDVAKAKQALQQCGQPNGFTTSISYRIGRPKEKAVAESLQQSLARVGIKLQIKGYPAGDYYKLYAGKPDFALKNKLGLEVGGWGADWPDGFGFLSQITDSRVIRATGGNTNLSVKDPAVDQLIDKALNNTDATGRQADWVNVDKKVMSDAFILPGIWAKGLLYRPKTLTNVFVTDGYQMYDYLALGKKQ